MTGIILIVDDEQRHLAWHQHHLANSGRTILSASTLDELDAAYNANRKEIVAIILDGCIPGNSITTRPFIQRVRRDMDAGEYTGLLVAASSSSMFRLEMVRLGCTHNFPKEFAAERTLHLLNM